MWTTYWQGNQDYVRNFWSTRTYLVNPSAPLRNIITKLVYELTNNNWKINSPRQEVKKKTPRVGKESIYFVSIQLLLLFLNLCFLYERVRLIICLRCMAVHPFLYVYLANVVHNIQFYSKHNCVQNEKSSVQRMKTFFYFSLLHALIIRPARIIRENNSTVTGDDSVKMFVSFYNDLCTTNTVSKISYPRVTVSSAQIS